jgi:hypothetical protein
MRREGVAIGLFFVAAGALFLLDAFEVITVKATYLWPLLLIGFGIALISGARRPAREPTPAPEREEEAATEEHREEPPADGTPPEDDDRA